MRADSVETVGPIFILSMNASPPPSLIIRSSFPLCLKSSRKTNHRPSRPSTRLSSNVRLKFDQWISSHHSWSWLIYVVNRDGVKGCYVRVVINHQLKLSIMVGGVVCWWCERFCRSAPKNSSLNLIKSSILSRNLLFPLPNAYSPSMEMFCPWNVLLIFMWTCGIYQISKNK